MQQYDKKDPNNFLFAETSSEDGDHSNSTASVIEADWPSLQQKKQNGEMKERPELAALASYTHQVNKYFKEKGALQYQSSPIVPPQDGLFSPAFFSTLPPMQVRGHSSQEAGPRTVPVGTDGTVVGSGAGTTAVNVFNAAPEGTSHVKREKKKKKKKVKTERGGEREEGILSIQGEAPTQLCQMAATGTFVNDAGEDAPPGLRHTSTNVFLPEDSSAAEQTDTKLYPQISHSATLPPVSANGKSLTLQSSLAAGQLNRSREASATTTATTTTTTTTTATATATTSSSSQQQQQQEQVAWGSGGGVPALRSHLYYEQENGALVNYVQHGRCQAQREEALQQQEAAEAKREQDRRRREQLYGSRGFGERPGARERTVSAAALRRWSGRDDAAGYRPFLVHVLRYLQRINLFLNAFACGAAVLVLILVTISNREQTANMMVVTLENASSINVDYNDGAGATLGETGSSVTNLIVWSSPTRLALLSALMSLFDPAFFIILSLLLVITTLVPVACGFADRQWRNVRRGQWSTLLSGTAGDEEGGEAAVGGRGAGSATTMLDLRMNEVNQHVNEVMAAQQLRQTSLPLPPPPPPPPPEEEAPLPPLGTLTASETNTLPLAGSKEDARRRKCKKADLYRSADYQLDAATTAQLTTAAFLQHQKRKNAEESENANKENMNILFGGSTYYRPDRTTASLGETAARLPLGASVTFGNRDNVLTWADQPYNVMERSASYGRGAAYGSGPTSPQRRQTLASSGTLFGSKGLFSDDDPRHSLSTLNSANNTMEAYRRRYVASNAGTLNHLGGSGGFYHGSRRHSYGGGESGDGEDGSGGRCQGATGTAYSLTRSIHEDANLEANNVLTRVSFAVENWVARHCLFLLCCVRARSQRLVAMQQHGNEPATVPSKKDRSVLRQYYYHYYVEVEGLYLLFQPRLWCLVVVLALSVAELSVLDQKESLDLLLSLEMNRGPVFNFSFATANSTGAGGSGIVSSIDLSQRMQASYKTTDGKLLLGIFATRATLLILSWLFDLFF